MRTHATLPRLICILIVAIAAVGATSSAQASLIIGATQFNSGDVLPSPIVAVSNDLLQTNLASVTGENSGANVRNGSTGTAHETSGTNPAMIWGSSQTTYVLDTSVNTLGYNISEIRAFSGWMDARAAQSYTIDYSLVSAPSTFLPLGTIDASTFSNGSLLTRTYDTTGASILTGVAAIQFNQNDIDVGGGVIVGTGTVFREFDVLGTPTLPTPEPTSLVLFGLGAIGLFVAARRRLA